MFDARPSQPDVEVDRIIWLNLKIREDGLGGKEVRVIGKTEASSRKGTESIDRSRGLSRGSGAIKRANRCPFRL